jgi:HSP20 family protein
VTRRSARAPISAFALLQQEVNELFYRLSALDGTERSPAGEWCPPVDVYESRDRLLVVVEVPGLAPDSLRVSFRERTLVLCGERRPRRAGGAVSFLCLERAHGRFERSIPLPVPVDVAHASATLGGGLLTVSVPRLRERRGSECAVPIEREPVE